MPVKQDLGSCNHLQSPDLEVSSKAGISAGISLMVMLEEGWVGSRPITFNWQVIMSMVVIPHTSWIILVTTTVDPTTWGRACSPAGRGWGNWPLCKVLAISTNPGGGVCSWALALSSGVSTSGLYMAKGPSVWVVATSFECPMSLVSLVLLISPVPLVLALQFLLQLHSWGVKAQWFCGLGGVTQTIWGLYWVEYFSISEHDKWLHTLLQLLDAFCQLAWLIQQCGCGYFGPML